MTNQFTQDDLEIIISTMNQTSLDFLIPMFPMNHFSKFSILVINQTNKNSILSSEFESVKVVNSFEIGLSKSRNLGIKNASKPIIILTDDDVVFADDFVQKIINSFTNYPNQNIFRFQVQSLEKKFLRNYPTNFIKRLNKFEVLNTMSVELVFRKSVFDKTTILYDENFGLGAKFAIGEENSLLLDFKKESVTIGFIPEVLCYHDEKHSSAILSKHEIYYYSGAFFYRNFGSTYKFWILLKLFFELKQRKILFSVLSKLYKQAILGKNDYKKISN
ncbi:glycosyltransferase [Flavobacterium azooxidireducens]|uniref:Glycosyltransferase n=1 Tax=Flavobacterium azooxidireducens TaxID=1871076 RepID=A0ABY4KCL7_9FLAO|nr:glycosyltransferase [Flavobacterium azooxidireducens]UPQ78543.1 glycosyltransferase [Flavobacterium azooxidireducens]